MKFLQQLPSELYLHVHSFHDTFRQDFQKIILPNLLGEIKKRQIEHAFDLLSKFQVQEAYDYIMDDNQFNYELVKTEPILHQFDKTWFMNRIRMNKCWNI